MASYGKPVKEGRTDTDAKLQSLYSTVYSLHCTVLYSTVDRTLQREGNHVLLTRTVVHDSGLVLIYHAQLYSNGQLKKACSIK